MPLTKIGKKIHRRFQKEYGKKLGNKIFYELIKKNHRITRGWHKK